MRVSIPWLKKLVDLNLPVKELVNLLPLKSISTKEVTDDFIELDMKGYNRTDLLSMRGVAQEIAAVTGCKCLFKDPQESQFVWNTQKLPQAQVEVQSPQLAPFYTITKIEGLKVDKSPVEWIKKLEESGIRSINNIADITNLIMLEYGQPLHSFDADRVEDGKIIVRTARPDEEIITLDGKKRKLSSSDLLIADPKKPIGIAGVMGGENTEVTASTATILLEAAIFDPVNIRKTVTSLGLLSEASKRFQHGLTKTRLYQALNAAIEMYESLGGKLTAVTLEGDFENKLRKVTLTQKKIDELIGVNIPKDKVESYLKSLGFGLEANADSWEATVPYWRLDIELEEDVIEEVARMYGYEKIPAEPVSESKPLQDENPIFQEISDLKDRLVDLGLTEVQTYSFYSTAIINALGWDNEKEKLLVKIANPISSETEYLRQSIWPNLLEVVNRNMRKGFKDIGIFEIGKAFNNIDGNPSEDYRLAIALMNGTDNPLEELASIAKKLGLEFKQSTTPAVVKNLFHPKRFMGPLAEVHLRVLNKLGIEKRVAVLEIELASLQ